MPSVVIPWSNVVNANPFGVTFYVSNTTNPTEGQGSPGTQAQGRTPKNPFTTIQRAVDEVVGGRGDTLVIQRGTYTQNVAFNKAGLTVIGAVPYGYPDHVVISGRSVVSAANCSFYNLEFFSNSGDFPSLRLGAFSDATDQANSTWCENCSFASDGTTEPEAGVLIFGSNNLVFKNCWFIDNTFGINLHGNRDSYPSHVVVEGCHFVENTTAHMSTAIGVFDASLGVTAIGAVGNNLLVKDSVFNRGAVTPADYINLVGGNGLITGCRFANATNAVGDIIIAAGVLYSTNATEAGWSTARPA